MDAIADPIELPAGSNFPASTLDYPEPPGQITDLRRRPWLGLSVGLGIGLLLSAHTFSTIGYRMFPEVLAFYLTWFPGLGMVAGYGVTRPRRPGPFYRRWLPLPQFRTWALMLLVAYMAVIYGLIAATARLGATAKMASQQVASARMREKIYGDLGRSTGQDAALARANVEGLRNGKYPEGLMDGQAEFLKNLEVDPKITPDYRAYRKRLILEGWEERAARQGHNTARLIPLAEYHAQLAAKYERIRDQPWLPFAPDPPEPPMP